MSRPPGQDARPPIDPIEEATAAAIFDAASLLVVVLGADGRIRRFNGACERATGFRAEEVLGESIWRLVPEDERPGTEEVFRELIERGRTNLHENDWFTKGGGRRRIAWSNTAIVGEDGAIERVIGTGIDVTELRVAEARRRESDSRLSGIVRSAMDAIVSVDERHEIVLFNPAAEEMFGYASGDMLGRPLDSLLPERFRPKHGDHVARFARAGQTSRRMGQLGRVWGLRKDGEEFPIEASISQMHSGDDLLLTVILRDVTEQEHAAETARLLESIVRSSNDAIVGTDPEDRVLTWNPAAEEIWGYSPEEIAEKTFEELMLPEERKALAAVLERARRGTTVGHLESRGLRKDGHSFDVSLGVSPRRDASGDVVGASVIARDISERRNLERRLRQTEELAAIATLVTGIAHDIGTPMNVILGYTDLLARSLREERDRERLGIIRDQVERVTRLVQTLMNFARPEREKARSLNIENVIDRALGLIAETTRKRGITIERDYEETGALIAQSERLERAFLDLFVNACDAMAGSGGELRVTTRSLPDAVEIRVADTGTGIAPDALEHIFEPFYTSKPRGQGTGLGLLVTRTIVLEHGGAIDVTSELERGTEFRIQLPRDGAIDDIPSQV